MTNLNKTFDWGEELHQTVVKSLATSFGLDFLLFEDKVGGNVDTIHNARQQVYATAKEREKYAKRGDYNSTSYHHHENYIATNREGKAKRKAGTLTDTYTGETFAYNGKTNLDHIKSAKEVHDDPGRVLADLNGSDLANDRSNLTLTNETLNKAKGARTMDAFVKKLSADYQATQQEIASLRSQLSLTALERKRLDSLENKASADFDRMREADKKARKQYEDTVNQAYYTSSKFAKSVALASASSGLNMGTRQVLGLMLAEVWFEFRARLPEMVARHKDNFVAGDLLSEMGDVLKAIWSRIRAKFRIFLEAFKDGAIGGILSSVTTTLFNLIFTTQKMMVRLIREMWNNLIQAFKIMVFNPENLAPGELAKTVSKLLAAGVAVAAGVVINESLAKIMPFPFGPELAAFSGALATGLLTVVMNYFLEYSPIMQKLWVFLNKFKDKYQHAVDYFLHINAELDRFIFELSSLEFAMNTSELALFSLQLGALNSEVERGLLLRDEAAQRNITLPFEAGNTDSVRSWLNSL
ncbi:cobalamin adenosyltransferase [Duffyella gerundensis]|uniref:cobalamin adenosyltransferase n=1 Tax=Duffyella TaxID=3026546 RepID=UPI003F6E0164